MLRLYDYLASGNAYKVRLLLHQLGIPFERVEMDIVRGETRTPEFLARNPNGRIPTLELEDGTHLAESNAILFYLAEGTPFLPATRFERALVLQWMCFEQYSHEPNIAVLRFCLAVADVPLPEPEIQARRKAGYRALDAMERELAPKEFLVAGRYTIADIALYAYTHVAGEGGFDLSGYPAIRAWLERVAGQSGHIPITA